MGGPGAVPEPQIAPPPKMRRRPAMIALAVACICVGGLASAWAWTATSNTNQVLTVRETIHRGQVIAAENLVPVQLGTDPALRAVPAARMDELVGRTATLDIPVGSVITEGQWSAETVPGPGRSVVGVSLTPGLLPENMVRAGDRVRVVMTSNGSAGEGGDDRDDAPVEQGVQLGGDLLGVAGFGTGFARAHAGPVVGAHAGGFGDLLLHPSPVGRHTPVGGIQDQPYRNHGRQQRERVAHHAHVAAMGNEYQEGNPTEYPGAYDGVFAVGSVHVLPAGINVRVLARLMSGVLGGVERPHPDAVRGVPGQLLEPRTRRGVIQKPSHSAAQIHSLTSGSSCEAAWCGLEASDQGE
jgi:hypothetical protein